MLCLILLLAASRVELVDEVYQIPPNSWRFPDAVISLKQRPALISAQYETSPPSSNVRIALLRREDLQKLLDGAPHGIIQTTPEGVRGALSYQAGTQGEYVVVIENEARTPATVHIRVDLDFARHGPTITQLSPQRQLTVVVISFAVFFAIVSFSARRLLRVVRRQN